MRVVRAEHSWKTRTLLRRQAVESERRILPHDVVNTIECTAHAAVAPVVVFCSLNLVLGDPDETIAAKCRPNRLDLILVFSMTHKIVQKSVPWGNSASWS